MSCSRRANKEYSNLKAGEEEEEEEESDAAYRNFYICLWAIISETTFASRKLPRHKYHKGKKKI